ncbi:hypothetical protein MHU86_10922 [Fragilaria crotonensis]|nr:hypothetical protein MHU86_10922 [Fragilaria crotonensis]
MMLFRTTLASLVLLLFLLITLVHADIDKKFEKFFRDRHDLDRGGSTVTKDDIKANMERRKLHLQKMLADSQDKVERHLAGEQGVFQGEETHDMLVKRMDAIRRKLERMEAVDDQELDRMHRRETRRSERRRSLSREL